jgi:hypothetical protein
MSKASDLLDRLSESAWDDARIKAYLAGVAKEEEDPGEHPMGGAQAFMPNKRGHGWVSAKDFLAAHDWEYVPAYPIAKLKLAADAEEGRWWEDPHYQELAKRLDEHPVVVVKGHGKLDGLVDGFHRASLADHAGKKTVPALVGTLRPGSDLERSAEAGYAKLLGHPEGDADIAREIRDLAQKEADGAYVYLTGAQVELGFPGEKGGRFPNGRPHDDPKKHPWLTDDGQLTASARAEVLKLAGGVPVRLYSGNQDKGSTGGWMDVSLIVGGKGKYGVKL